MNTQNTKRLSLSAVLLVALLLLLIGVIQQTVHAAPLNQASTNCVIPSSGPWPPCATGGTQSSNNNSCVIPPSGPWPDCARNGGGTTGGSSGGSGSGNCVIPPSGPWPACARNGGGTTGGSSGGDSYGDCIIPPSGPWPACAKDGNSSPIQAPEGFCLDPNNPNGGHSAWMPCETFAPVTPTPQPSNQPKLCPPPGGSGPWVLCDVGSGPARIIDFQAFVTPIDNGNDQIIYVWETTGATSVQLLVGVSDQWADHRIDLGLSGSDTTIYESDALTKGQIGLKACRQNQCDIKYIQTSFSCEHSYFFNTSNFNPGSCASDNYRERQAVVQQFEHGYMIWIDEWLVPYVGSGPSILPFSHFQKDGVSGGPFWSQPDSWTPGDPISDPNLTPPAGKRQPTHGIGKAWRETPQLREQLGWAISAEIPYTAKSNSEVGLGVFGSANLYLSLPDTNKVIVISCGQRTSAGSCNWRIADL